MKMQIMRFPTGQISKIFDLDAVELVEMLDDGKRIEVTLRSGKTFTAFELMGYSEMTAGEVMEWFRDAFKKEDT